ncbi:T7-like mitochondrial DNA helicase [Tieghemostelium lacteum]|uniref:T7-like mitochondrial DNA helicase n=1 Tax=Tieghemostelium lacteum TaxID=361077 RepID=A0A151ZK59_TIELA|nr:T7-like mitochondrial DNA helicase [Tieghemostelium lacteum]|eukprot:KYQ94381.1 T7-like mitochondrial DNA helicase [Tieghemostelium lacteum]
MLQSTRIFKLQKEFLSEIRLYCTSIKVYGSNEQGTKVKVKGFTNQKTPISPQNKNIQTTSPSSYKPLISKYPHLKKPFTKYTKDSIIDATNTPTNNLNSNNYNNNTFVSSHYKVNVDNILQYLDRKKLVYKIVGQEIIIKECPFCPDTKGKFDNLWKLYISKETAAYFCHRCANKGSWIDLKVNLGDLTLDQMGVIQKTSNANNNNNYDDINPTDLKKLNAYSAELKNHPDVIKKLTGTEKGERGLSMEVLELYRVGVTSQSFFVNDQWEEHKCITFPWTYLDSKGNVMALRCKLRSTKEKALQRIEPKGGKWGFFGWHTVPLDAKEIILTEGEYDAMAVYLKTGIPTISLPNGANSLPITLLPMLERFEKIYLWMDDDVPGQEGALKFAEKLGIKRTFIVSTKQSDPNGPKDANDALLMGKDLNQILLSSQTIPHDQICGFSDVKSIIHAELKDPMSVVGKQSQWFPTFNRLLKGHRKGELTVFSGSTGVGKTSVLTQLSLDFCKQGVRTLWGSFELSVPRLAKKMMTQFANKNLEKNIQEFPEIANEFNNLPVYFLRFFGSTHVDKVLDAMEYAVYVQDVEHIILDNLQFMLSGQAKGVEKFDTMDESIEKLRKFATQKNVHITVVIHPRKQETESTLSINDIFGTAKATQEADNVIIFQRTKDQKYLDIKKNRFSGHLGSIPLGFNQDTQRFYEISNIDTSNDNNNNTIENNNQDK